MFELHVYIHKYIYIYTCHLSMEKVGTDRSLCELGYPMGAQERIGGEIHQNGKPGETQRRPGGFQEPSKGKRMPYDQKSLIPSLKEVHIPTTSVNFMSHVSQPGLPEGILTFSNKECLHVGRPSGSPNAAGRFPQPCIGLQYLCLLPVYKL